MKEVYTALITPFDAEGAIDYVALKKVIEYLQQQGNTKMVLCGTTAESCTLRLHEKKQLVRYVRYHYPELELIVGISSNCTHDVLRQMQELQHIQDIDRYMIVTPYYNKPTQAGLYQHYDTIAKHTEKQIILYNVPSRTGCSLETQTIIDLVLENKNIVALKEAGQIQDIPVLKEKLPFFKVFVGNDNVLKEALALGADGIISVASHIDYPLVARVCTTGDSFDDAYLKVLASYLFKETSPAPVKYILSKWGYIQNRLRLPLVGVSPALEKELDSIAQKYKY